MDIRLFMDYMRINTGRNWLLYGIYAYMYEIILTKKYFPAILECNYLVCHTPFVHADRTVLFNVLIYVKCGQITVTEDAGELLFLKSGVHHYGKKQIKAGTSWYYIHFILQNCGPYESDFLTIPKKTTGLAHC